MTDAFTTPEDDQFLTPDDEEEANLNVSGQPPARYEETRTGQKKGYALVDPHTGDFFRYKNGNKRGITRVTTFVKAASDQGKLHEWGKRNVLIGASRRPDLVDDAYGLTHEGSKTKLDTLVAQLEEAAGGKVSSRIGTTVHELTERMDAGLLDPHDVPPAYRRHVASYAAALDAAKLRPVPRMIERTVLFKYQTICVVGTFDRVFWDETSEKYVIGDLKTGRDLSYGWDEIRAQLALYARGHNQYGVYDWNEDRWEDPIDSEIDTEAGVVMHLPVQGDDAATCTLLRADLDRGWDYVRLCQANREMRSTRGRPEKW